MSNRINIAIVRDDGSTHILCLMKQLAAQSCAIKIMKSCAELAAELAIPDPPDLVFTEVSLPDGTWEDSLRLAGSAPLPVNVIVVSRLADIRLYIEVLEKGAFDFITPPFEGSELSHVVRSALWNISKKRAAKFHGALFSGSSEMIPDCAVAG